MRFRRITTIHHGYLDLMHRGVRTCNFSAIPIACWAFLASNLSTKMFRLNKILNRTKFLVYTIKLDTFPLCPCRRFSSKARCLLVSQLNSGSSHFALNLDKIYMRSPSNKFFHSSRLRS